MTTATTSVTATTTADVPIERAFAVFTAEIGSWWHPRHHIIDAPFDHMVFEPFVGGHIYDVGTDGSECRWSRVLAYQPPDRVVFSWDISPSWELENDPVNCSEVEVQFTVVGPTTTRVVLEHKHLDRHGADWTTMLEAVSGGWQANGLDRFAAACSSTDGDQPDHAHQ